MSGGVSGTGGGGRGGGVVGGGGMMYDVDMDTPLRDEYGVLFSCAADFFAGLLLPKHALCYQKFALTVDDLFFIGHPVGTWQFRHEKYVRALRGRGGHKRRVSTDDLSLSTDFDLSALENNCLPPSCHIMVFFNSSLQANETFVCVPPMCTTRSLPFAPPLHQACMLGCV